MPYIWLDEKLYPGLQKNYYNINGMTREAVKGFAYCVAEFKKDFTPGKTVRSARVSVSADCFFQLYADGKLIGLGPAAAGGDFLTKGPAPAHYLNTYDIDIDSPSFELKALVRLLPDVLTDFSRGHGGFFARVVCLLEDGTECAFETGGDWLSRPRYDYTDFLCYDGRRKSPDFAPSQEIEDIWNDAAAPIDMLSLNRITPANGVITMGPGEKKTTVVTLDRIYGAYPCARATGACRIRWRSCELEGQDGVSEEIVLAGGEEYMSFRMHSLGMAILETENLTDGPATLTVSMIATWYPVTREGALVTSNADYNRIYDVCRHTLKICRQTLHLDSTTHQELLACTGDYYIETLMNMFCFGDMKLSELDVMRTADWLKANDGRMFHTTYSLIWVLMLRDVYSFTGNRELLLYCRDALKKLLDKFESYRRAGGLVEDPPDFMFIDWTVIDGFSMHHPPKCLGQAALNAYYYGALRAAGEIYGYMGMPEEAGRALDTAGNVKSAFLSELWDDGRKLFFDGKGDPCGDGSLYSPYNVDRRYFSQYPNILAVCFGIVEGDEAKRLLERTINDPHLQDIQPYFMHWEMCALRGTGLFAKYGPGILARYADVVRECGKGLKEGWIAPQPDYSFDHSHAWGGTPAYQLPMALTGLRVLEPGMRRLSFRFDLCGLDSAYIRIPAPAGDIGITLAKGQAPVVCAPAGIEISIETGNNRRTRHR